MPVNGFSAVLTEETTGEYVRKSGHIIYGDFYISEITKDSKIIGKVNVIEELKGKFGKKEFDVRLDLQTPVNYQKLISDLRDLKVSASEDIEAAGSSKKRVIIMFNKIDGGYDFLRFKAFFRPDKLEIYYHSFKEIVSMTNISDKEKLLKTIKYNLGEEFSFSLYNHCFDELFKLDISFAELFSTIKEFLLLKGKKKIHSWFKVFKRTGKVLEKGYDEVDENTKDDFFSYLHESYINEPEDNEYTNKRFLELFYDLRRLILKNPKWQKKFHDAVNKRDVTVEGLSEDHFRNVELKELKGKLLRSLSK
jgi:hypothetical protein